jgi:hypothetical protein
MKILERTAGSLVFAFVSLALTIATGLFMLSGRGDTALVLLWVVFPPLMLFTLCYLIADLVSASRRRHGLFALLASIPGFALEIWFWKTFRL